MNLSGKTVVLTGGSTGIGRATGKELLKRGAKLIVLGINKPDYKAEFIKTDLANETEINNAVSKIKKLDVLINNAGIAELSTIEKTSSVSFDKTFNINFRGMFILTSKLIPKINRQGLIVNISSIAGLKSFPGASVYCASKSAIASFTKTLALELAKNKIRANAIAPGVIETEIWDKMYGSKSKKMLTDSIRAIPAGRAGRPEEIAHTITFLAENEFVNGTIITVDGGQLA